MKHDSGALADSTFLTVFWFLVPSHLKSHVACLFPEDAKTLVNHLNGPKFYSNFWISYSSENEIHEVDQLTNFIKSEPPKDQHQQGLHSKLQTLAGPKHHSLKKTESYNLSLQNEKQGGNMAIFMLNILIHHQSYLMETCHILS